MGGIRVSELDLDEGVKELLIEAQKIGADKTVGMLDFSEVTIVGLAHIIQKLKDRIFDLEGRDKWEN